MLNLLLNKRKPSPDGIKYVDFSMRMLASIIDSLVSLVALYPFVSVINYLVGSKGVPKEILDKFYNQIPLTDEQRLIFINAMIDALVSSMYQFLLLGIIVLIFWFYRGATPGKMILKMRIVDSKTLKQPSKTKLIIRFLGYFISTIPLGLGFIWIYYDKKHRAFHDLIAGTVVVKVGKDNEVAQRAKRGGSS